MFLSRTCKICQKFDKKCQRKLVDGESKQELRLKELMTREEGVEIMTRKELGRKDEQGG